jgi:hypothetical protein
MLSTWCFSVAADAAPGSLSRVLDVLQLFAEVPTALSCRRHGPAGAVLVIEAELDGLGPATAAALARRLERLVAVEAVLFSEKCRCVA